METSVKLYRKYMFMYGIISVLFVLKHFEETEDYEECKKIIDSIREQEERLECKFPTVINKEAVQEVLTYFKKSEISEERLLDMCEYYSTIILREIKNL